MITIQLTKEELDLLWYALGKLPYEQSYKLIANLTTQYQEQTKNEEPEEETGELEN